MTGTSITLRDCTPDDAEMLFEWRNHPQIIALSSSKQSVEWEEHYAWLDRCLSQPGDHRIYLIVDKGSDIGVVRLDRKGDIRATISVYLLPDWWGSGLGEPAISAGIKEVAARWPDLEAVEANVIRQNERAVRVFEKCGFVQLSDQRDEGLVNLEYRIADAGMQATPIKRESK